VCHLAIKVEKQFKGGKPLHTSITKSSSTPIEVKTSRPQVNTLDMGKEIVREPLERLEGKKCFKYHDFGHFQADCPNRKALTIKKVEDI